MAYPNSLAANAALRSKTLPITWPKSRLAFIVAALVLFALGFYLRFHHLTLVGLWTDELFTASAALDVGCGTSWLHFTPKLMTELNSCDSFLTWNAADNTPPLFQLLLIAWCKFFGESDLAIRSLNAVLGSVTPIVFFFGLRRVLGDFAAILGAAIFVFSPSAVVYAQEARAYTLSAFLCTLALVRIVNRIFDDSAGNSQDQRSKRSVWIDVVLLILLTYSHYTGLFAAGLLFLLYFLFVAVPQKRYRDIAKFALVPLAIFPWMWLSKKALLNTIQGGFAWRDYHFSDIFTLMVPETIDFFLFGAGGLFVAIWFVALVASLTGVAKSRTWIFSFDGISTRLGDRKNFLALCLAVSVILLFFFNVYDAFHAKMWHPRYLAVAIPIVFTSLALLFSSQRLGKAAPLVFTALIIIFSVISLIPYYKNGNNHKEEYREASGYVSRIARNGSIIVLGWKPNAAYYNHYLKQFLNSSTRYELTTVSTLEDVDQFCDAIHSQDGQIILFQHKDMQPYYAEMRKCQNLKLVAAKRFRRIILDEYSTVQ